MIHSRAFRFLFVIALGTAGNVSANGVLRNGAGGRSMGVAGASVAAPLDPVAALYANPAGLAAMRAPALTLGAMAIYADATFTGGVEASVDLDEPFGIAPELALAVPLRDTPVTLGLSVIPEVTRLSQWYYTDAPGGLDGNTSYGFRLHNAEIISVRTALGAGWQVNDQLSVGASAGLAWQDISLHAPFIFQSFAPLRGIKTPLNLDTEDHDAWNADLGLLYKATDKLTLGLNFRTKTDITSEGTAAGNADVQLQNLGLGAARSDFRYDAEVETALPAVLTAGVHFKHTKRLHFSAQVDWINWSDSFDTLVVHLSNGNNADLNAIAGGSSLTDRIPLDWDDVFVGRLGVEYSPADRWWLRAGYAYGDNPIPNRNLTPLNAAISEHTLTAGVGYVAEKWNADFAWQYDLPHGENTGVSNILDGEYSGTSTKLAAHWFGLSVTRRF
jgi:long-chain fatty acid transport protein